jgi:hypothetical protein
MKAAALILAILALATPAVAIDDNDRFLMVIDAGRLGVMMDQSERILNVAPGPTSATTDTFAVLKAAVVSYRLLLGTACARHAVGRDLCDAALYSPRWMAEPDTPGPAPAVLRARIDEAQDRIAPLWGALCGKLPKDHDPSLCQLE